MKNTNIKNTTENINKIQEEKVMKKEMIIDMVESTYEIVGKTRTISNCTGIDESERTGQLWQQNIFLATAKQKKAKMKNCL